MILDSFRIDGQVAVITGGTKGLGGSISLALAEAGADIVLVSRKPNAELESQIKKLGRRCKHIAADLTKREHARSVIPEAVNAMGDVNILVNNAGIIRRSPATDYQETDWDDTIEIDLTSAFILSQAAGRIMVAKGRGKILNIASVLSFQGGLNVVAYATAKHGIGGMTKALSNEWSHKGVNVNAIAPSFFITELTEALQKDEARFKSIQSRTPAGRWGEPEEISGAALFLVSGAASFIHGVVLPVDGGWMAW